MQSTYSDHNLSQNVPYESHMQPQVPSHLQPCESQSHDSGSKKPYNKNKFITKIQQLQQVSKSQINTHPNARPSSVISSIPSTRRQRNKIAAQESRNRKNLYIKMMEQNIGNLQEELKETEKAIEEARQAIFSAQMHQKHTVNEAKHKQVHIIKKLQRLLSLQKEEDRQNEINICLDSIFYRIGALGKERKSALGKLYSDLFNYSRPALYRYILWSAAKKKDLFGQFSEQDEDLWTRQINQIAQEAIKMSDRLPGGLTEKGQQIAALNQKFKKSASDLVNFRTEFQKKGQLLDDKFNQIREQMTPQQTAQLILFVEKYQFKGQIQSLFEGADDEPCSNSRKKVKTDSDFAT